ncbi:MAG: hypothetical protein HY064_15765 [Bacteroidetes bacterium]|nr:hypothetical protein [Bacteroidota bacterium]
MKLNFSFPVLLAGVILFAANSCSSDGDNHGKGNNDSDSLKVTGVMVKGQSFMVPSPLQIADIIKKSGALYKKDMLNPTANLSKYSDASKRAMNLGIYGADLGYITMYENTGDATEYYKTVMQLGEQLKITGSFDANLMKRFSDNLGKKDSILSLVGEAYRKSDQFLRESNQENVAGLILAGGWIEGIYFALNVYKDKPDETVSVRIGEQKGTAAGIVKVLTELQTPDNPHAELNDLIKLFQDLDVEYKKIEIKYTFADPTDDEAAHVTTINGKTEVKITPEQMAALVEKVNAIRDYIIK